MVTTFGAPMLYFVNETTALFVKVIASSAVMGFGFFTTGFLHFCSGPYVHQMWIKNRDAATSIDDTIVVSRTMSYLGQPQYWQFKRSDLRAPDGKAFRPWVTHDIVDANGKVLHQLYLHPEDIQQPLLANVFKL
jgi:hypothetical protein